MPDAVQARIKRATLAAHRAVEQLDAAAIRDLTRIYREAAAEIAARIRAHAGAADSIAIQELRGLLDQVEGILRDLGGARNALLDRNLAAAAELGVRPYAGTVEATALVQTSREALQFVRSFVAEDGLQLSDRLWRLDRGARDQLVNQIERAVVQGQSAHQAALEFLARGEAPPADLQDKAKEANAGRIARSSEELMVKGAGNPLDQAMRVMRTEINRAHGEAYMKGGESVPGFAGWKFLLSPAHPAPDICDLLSTQNLYGLGPGVYPSRSKTPWPAHPNTLSFIVIVFDDEITKSDREGRETPLEALKRLPDEKQKGVLGEGKKEILDQGKLRQGMIRTPLRVVKKRIARQEA